MKKNRILFCMAAAAILLFWAAGGRTEAMEFTERQVTAIELPQNLNFYLDPENKYENGQIYSEKYIIRNAGREAVDFSIDLTLALADSGTQIAFCPKEWEEEPQKRSVYMYAMFEKGREKNTCVLTDAEASGKERIILEPAGQEGDTVSISFGGMLSQTEGWKSGELMIHALYAVSAKKPGYHARTEGEHIKLENAAADLTEGQSAELYLVPDEGYSLPAKIRAYMDGRETDASYDAVSGRIFLEKVTGDIVIQANGITKAAPPPAETMNEEEMIWSWTAEEGVQAYEYTFLQNDTVIQKGRIKVENGQTDWNWSEGLANGEYQLYMKAVGDNIHCLNSEEGSYSVTVSRELLQPAEGTEEMGE